MERNLSSKFTEALSNPQTQILEILRTTLRAEDDEKKSKERPERDTLCSNPQT